MKTKIIVLLLIFLTNPLLSSDSLAILKYDPKLGLDMKGLINQPSKPIKIIETQIEKIKKIAQNFPIEDVLENDIVIMETSVGKLKLKLFPEIAPEHCKNFKRLANSGFYDGTTFHRVIQGFMIQGGDILSRDFDPENDGTGSPGWTVPAEFNKTPHKRGILSMARASDPNSAGSQFFICVEDTPHLDEKYTVFGEVISNFHVIDRIAKTPTGYSIANLSAKDSIPKGEDLNKWVTLTDPKSKKEIYSKIPLNMNKNAYRNQQQKFLYSDRPLNDVLIKKIRVKPIEQK